MPAPPNFALLIGKRLGAKKDGGEMDEDGDYDAKEDSKQHDMEVSAMNDFIGAVHAKDPESACAAMDDYMKLVLEERDEDEGAPPEAAE